MNTPAADTEVNAPAIPAEDDEEQEEEGSTVLTAIDGIVMPETSDAMLARGLRKTQEEKKGKYVSFGNNHSKEPKALFEGKAAGVGRIADKNSGESGTSHVEKAGDEKIQDEPEESTKEADFLPAQQGDLAKPTDEAQTIGKLEGQREIFVGEAEIEENKYGVTKDENNSEDDDDERTQDELNKSNHSQDQEASPVADLAKPTDEDHASDHSKEPGATKTDFTKESMEEAQTSKHSEETGAPDVENADAIEQLHRSNQSQEASALRVSKAKEPNASFRNDGKITDKVPKDNHSEEPCTSHLQKAADAKQEDELQESSHLQEVGFLHAQHVGQADVAKPTDEAQITEKLEEPCALFGGQADAAQTTEKLKECAIFIGTAEVAKIKDAVTTDENKSGEPDGLCVPEAKSDDEKIQDELNENNHPQEQETLPVGKSDLAKSKDEANNLKHSKEPGAVIDFSKKSLYEAKSSKSSALGLENTDVKKPMEEAYKSNQFQEPSALGVGKCIVAEPRDLTQASTHSREPLKPSEYLEAAKEKTRPLKFLAERPRTNLDKDVATKLAAIEASSNHSVPGAVFVGRSDPTGTKHDSQKDGGHNILQLPEPGALYVGRADVAKAKEKSHNSFNLPEPGAMYVGRGDELQGDNNSFLSQGQNSFNLQEPGGLYGGRADTANARDKGDDSFHSSFHDSFHSQEPGALALGRANVASSKVDRHSNLLSQGHNSRLSQSHNSHLSLGHNSFLSQSQNSFHSQGQSSFHSQGQNSFHSQGQTSFRSQEPGALFVAGADVSAAKVKNSPTRSRRRSSLRVSQLGGSLRSSMTAQSSRVESRGLRRSSVKLEDTDVSPGALHMEGSSGFPRALGEEKSKRLLRDSSHHAPTEVGAHSMSTGGQGEPQGKFRRVSVSNGAEQHGKFRRVSMSNEAKQHGKFRRVSIPNEEEQHGKFRRVGGEDTVSVPGAMSSTRSTRSMRWRDKFNKSFRSHEETTSPSPRIRNLADVKMDISRVSTKMEDGASSPVSNTGTASPVLNQQFSAVLEESSPISDQSSRSDLRPVVSDSELVTAMPVVTDDEEEDMPQADEYDEEAAKQRKRSGSKKTRLRLGALVIVVLAVVLIIIFATGSTRRGEDTVVELSASPTTSPSAAPSSQEDKILDLLPAATIDAIIGDDDSPQSLAFQWLLNDTNMTGYSDMRVVQRFALATLFYSTQGEKEWHDYMSKGWLEPGLHECEWSFNTNNNSGTVFNILTQEALVQPPKSPCGVPEWAGKTSNSNNDLHYTHLWIPDANLVGEIPPEIFLLTSLLSISFQENFGLSGTLPTQIGRLSSLEHLNLGPENEIAGPLPTEIGKCTNLIHLLLPNATSTLPTTIGQLQSLKFLMVRFSMLSGSIPSEIGLMEELEELVIEGNQFNGTVPREVWQMSSLALLDLGGNRFSGTISTVLGKMSNLTFFAARFNQLSGPIPSEVANLSKLGWFEVFGNLLTGSIPSELLGITKMKDFEVNKNALTGTIPSALGLLTNLESIYVSNNGFVGAIPTELGMLERLTALSLWDNRLTGTIPSELGLLSMADRIYLDENRLTGTVPSQLGGLEKLRELSAPFNDLTGTIPDEVCRYDGSIGWFDFDCSESLCGCSSCMCPNTTVDVLGSNVTNDTLS